MGPGAPLAGARVSVLGDRGLVAQEPGRALLRRDQRPARIDEEGRHLRGDDRRTCDLDAGVEVLARPDRGLEGLVMADEVAGAVPARGRGGRAFGLWQRLDVLELHRLVLAIARHADGVDPDTCLGRLAALAEALAIVGRELVDDLQHVARAVQLVDRDHRRGLHQLVAIAHVQFQVVLDLLGRHALAQQVLTTAFLQFGHDAVEPLVIAEDPPGVAVVKHHVERLLVDVELVHVARPHRREHRAERRRQDLVDRQVLRDAAAMQRPVAAIGEHGEVLRIIAARTQFGEKPVRHVGIDLLANELGRLDHRDIELVAQRILDRRLRPARVERDRAAGIVLGVEIAEQQVGVGHRGLHPAAVVARRPRVRARAFRSAFHRLVHPVIGGNRATARAQRHQMHHRHRDQPAVDDRVEVIVLDAALDDDADVVGGAAHVGRHDVAKLGLQRQVLGRADARDRARVDGLQRVGRVQLRHAARVVDHQHRLFVIVHAQVLLERGQRVIHRRMQVAVDDRRGGTDVFALPARDLVRQDHRDRAQQMRGVFLKHDLLDALLVGGVHHRVHQRHDDDLGAAVDKLTQLAADVFLVEAHHQLALEIEPLADAADHVRLDQRVGTLGIRQVLLAHVVQPLAIAAGAAERHGGLVARGDQHADLRALVLDQRIGAERGGIAHRVHLLQDVLEFKIENLAGLAQRLVEPHREVVVRGQCLGLDIAPTPDDEAVGEGAADINGNAFHALSLCIGSGGCPPPAAGPGNGCAPRARRGGRRRSMGVAAPGHHGGAGVRQHRGAALGPLRLQRGHIDLHVPQRRVTRGGVFRLDLGAAFRAAELEDAHPVRIGREGVAVLRRVDHRRMDLARVAVVHQQPFLVIARSRRDHVIADAAFPLLGFEVDAQVLGHRHFHRHGLFLPVQNDVARFRDGQGPARRNERREVILLEDRGPLGPVARGHAVQPIDRQIGSALPRHKHAAACRGLGPGLAGHRDMAGVAVTQALRRHEFKLDRAGLRQIGREALALGEFVDHLALGGLRHQPCRHAVAARLEPFCEHVARGLLHQHLARRDQRRRGVLGQRHRIALRDVARADAIGREHRRHRRHRDALDPRLVGNTAGQQRPGAAEGHHHRVRRDLGEAMQLGRDLRLEGVGHHRHRGVEIDAQRLGDVGADRRLGAAGIKPHAAAEIGGGVEQTGEKAGVGDRRLLPAAAEASGAGEGAHAFRADHDLAILHLEDRAAAGAGRDDLAQRKGDRDPLDMTATDLGDLALGALADVGGGAADVDRDRVAEAVERGEGLHPFHAATRAGGIGLDRHRLRHARGIAVIAEDQQRVFRAVFAQPVLGLEQEGLHRRVQEGVDQRRPGTAVGIAVDGEVRSIEHRHRTKQVTRIFAQHDLLHPLLGLEEALAGEADHQPVRAGGSELVDRAHDLDLGIGVVEHGRIDEADAVADQRGPDLGVMRGKLRGQILGTLCQDQAQLRPLAFADRVGALRRRIADQVHFLEQPLHVGRAIDHFGGLLQALEEAFRQIVGCGQDLGLGHAVIRHDTDVGESPAVINVNLKCHCAFLLPYLLRRRLLRAAASADAGKAPPLPRADGPVREGSRVDAKAPASRWEICNRLSGKDLFRNRRTGRGVSRTVPSGFRTPSAGSSDTGAAPGRAVRRQTGWRRPCPGTPPLCSERHLHRDIDRPPRLVHPRHRGVEDVAPAQVLGIGLVEDVVDAADQPDILLHRVAAEEVKRRPARGLARVDLGVDPVLPRGPVQPRARVPQRLVPDRAEAALERRDLCQRRVVAGVLPAGPGRVAREGQLAHGVAARELGTRKRRADVAILGAGAGAAHHRDRHRVLQDEVVDPVIEGRGVQRPVLPRRLHPDVELVVLFGRDVGVADPGRRAHRAACHRALVGIGRAHRPREPDESLGVGVKGVLEADQPAEVVLGARGVIGGAVDRRVIVVRRHAAHRDIGLRRIGAHMVEAQPHLQRVARGQRSLGLGVKPGLRDRHIGPGQRGRRIEVDHRRRHRHVAPGGAGVRLRVDADRRPGAAELELALELAAMGVRGGGRDHRHAGGHAQRIVVHRVIDVRAVERPLDPLQRPEVEIDTAAQAQGLGLGQRAVHAGAGEFDILGAVLLDVEREVDAALLVTERDARAFLRIGRAHVMARPVLVIVGGLVLARGLQIEAAPQIEGKPPGGLAPCPVRGAAQCQLAADPLARLEARRLALEPDRSGRRARPVRHAGITLFHDDPVGAVERGDRGRRVHPVRTAAIGEGARVDHVELVLRHAAQDDVDAMPAHARAGNAGDRGQQRAPVKRRRHRQRARGDGDRGAVLRQRLRRDDDGVERKRRVGLRLFSKSNGGEAAKQQRGHAKACRKEDVHGISDLVETEREATAGPRHRLAPGRPGRRFRSGRVARGSPGCGRAARLPAGAAPATAAPRAAGGPGRQALAQGSGTPPDQARRTDISGRTARLPTPHRGSCRWQGR
ncbi:hypothetical protein SDC9_46434 [bioreactor metagenome]|uniref:Uncharacterized protein n=1 Tax=bioreactor metagenome TaxID=1076179 RepID=A0A644W9Q6_9ZZZZ